MLIDGGISYVLIKGFQLIKEQQERKKLQVEITNKIIERSKLEVQNLEKKLNESDKKYQDLNHKYTELNEKQLNRDKEQLNLIAKGGTQAVDYLYNENQKETKELLSRHGLDKTVDELSNKHQLLKQSRMKNEESNTLRNDIYNNEKELQITAKKSVLDIEVKQLEKREQEINNNYKQQLNKIATEIKDVEMKYGTNPELKDIKTFVHKEQSIAETNTEYKRPQNIVNAEDDYQQQEIKLDEEQKNDLHKDSEQEHEQSRGRSR